MVDPVGIRGVIGLFWKGKHMAYLLSYSSNHIDIMVSVDGMPPWRLTSFYGYPGRECRRDAWTCWYR
ncbi:conserved hypothetical protein [Ricinus communis]|uniref:Uncharacterized protein n=1 Tax=Ricinus communis TaxID=3988 RepID=B9SK85_RICCO|nr:conserved hypothetical protein [Ricinus communis]